MKPQALILDIDGTLWDSRALVAQGYNLQLREEGLDRLQVDVARLTSLFGKMDWELGDALFPEFPVPQRYQLLQRCMDREKKYLAENDCRIGYPGIRAVLEQLRKKYRLFLVSNCQKGYPELCIQKLGLDDFIEAHLCHGDTGKAKGETIRILMEKHAISSAVYIGDTQGDCIAARDAGIPFVWASYGFGSPESWDAKLEKPQDMLKIFM